MSVYSQRIAKLRKDIALIKSKKSKKFNKDQQIMIDFINGVTSKAEFILNDKNVTLHKGDENKGFEHILKVHFCEGCSGELKAMDILNMIDIVKRGIKLANHGVTNDSLVVYQRIKGVDHYKIVLKPMEDDNLVVTMYSVG